MSWPHTNHREKEKALLAIGREFRNAIGGYYERTPGTVKRYPVTLKDLLLDNRHLAAQRYLRKIYMDPMTGSAAARLTDNFA